MRQKTFNQLMLGFLESKDGEAAIGMIMKKAIDQSLARKICIEDGKSEPGKVVEKTKDVNILDHIAFYMPYVEGALRGVQMDTSQAKNKAAKTLNLLIEAVNANSVAKRIQSSEDLISIPEEIS